MSELDLLKEQTKEFLLDRYGVNGLVQSDIDSLDFYISEKTHDFINVIYNPSLCIILQGAKSVGFGDEMNGYNEQRYLAHINLYASKSEPDRRLKRGAIYLAYP